MSIIVEDGTGKATSESYISVADASTYFTARGITSWGSLATDALREAALRKATDYMTALYRTRWQGQRTTAAVQALCWPRVGVTIEGVYVDSATIPETIKRACAELALRASSADLQADLEQAVVAEQIGPIRVDYDRNSPQAKRYKAVESMLLPYLKSGGGCSMRLERV